MNNIDELYGHQWDAQLQHEHSKYQNSDNNQWVNVNPEDEMTLEAQLYIEYYNKTRRRYVFN